MPAKPPPSLVRVLSRLVDTGSEIEFQTWSQEAPGGETVRVPREGRRIVLVGASGENVLSPATLAKALRDGVLAAEQRGAFSFARPTSAGLALLDEWRWTLGSNEPQGYAVLRPYRFATRDVSPGPLLRVTSRTANRIWFDPGYAHPLDGDGRDMRKKGRGPKSWVDAADVLGTVDAPEDYQRIKEAHGARLSAIEDACMREAEEVEALAREVRERWEAERRRISGEGAAAVREAEAAVKPL